MRIVKELIEPIVEEAVKKKRERIASSGDGRKREKVEEEEGTLLENLVNETDDLEILRDEIMSLLVAGRDTVSYVYHASLHLFTPITDSQHVDLCDIYAR